MNDIFEISRDLEQYVNEKKFIDVLMIYNEDELKKNDIPENFNENNIEKHHNLCSSEEKLDKKNIVRRFLLKIF